MGRVLAVFLLAVTAFPAGLVAVKTPPQEVARSADVPASRDAASDLVEKIRKIIREGSDDPYVPVLDPLQIESQDLNFKEIGAYEVKGGIRNVVSTGLGDFEASMSTRNLILLSRVIVTVDISVPLLQARGKYSLDTLLGEVVHLYGNGNFEMDLSELNVTIVADINVFLTYSKLRSLTTSLNVGDFKFVVDGLLDGGLVDGIFNLAVNELAKVIFASQKSVLEDYLASMLEDPINEAIKDIGMSDLLCLIGLCGSSRGGSINDGSNFVNGDRNVIERGGTDGGNVGGEENGGILINNGYNGAGVRDRLNNHLPN